MATTVNLVQLREELYQELPAVAQELILSNRYQEPADPYRPGYAENPDDTLMHTPKWHQWGVVSHTCKVGEYLAEVVPAKLGAWFGESAEETRLGLTDEEIDGVSKWELLLLSAPVHDWGKFTSRQFEGEKNGLPKFDFGGHEAESGRLVRLRAKRFLAKGMTLAQVEYVARCAELHFELGKIRKAAKDSSAGYTIEWTKTESFATAAQKAATRYPGFEREVGILFLADSWGKTDLFMAIDAPDDESVEAFRPELEAEIKERGLNPALINAALQLPVNTHVGRQYLALLI